MFIVDNAVVFPDNIISVEDEAFYFNFFGPIRFAYGKNVQIIGKSIICGSDLQIARFSNLLEIGDDAFCDCYTLNQFIAPKCKVLGTGVFSGCYSLSKL